MRLPPPRRRALAAGAAALLALLVAVPAAAAGAPPQTTWHADQAHVPGARAAGHDGAGIVVAVLDTWIDAAHPDFEGRVQTGADCTTGTCRDGVPAPDECTHGTHVAGTVASSSYGVAPKATVLPVKVLSYSPPGAGQTEGSCSGSVASVAAGIRYAVAHAARVVNLSLGTLVPGLSSSSQIADAVGEAAAAGVVVVFAAGNSSVPVTDSYGGNAVIVAATGPDGSLASYSQRGVGVTLAAPGGDPPALGDCTAASCVTSLYPGGRYAVAAGTSMAAPHVAGIAALLIAQDPGRTRQQVVDRLRSTARPVAGGRAGDGLVDASAALGQPAASSAPTSALPQAPAAARSATPAPIGGAMRPGTSVPAGDGRAVGTGVATAPPVAGAALPVPLPVGGPSADAPAVAPGTTPAAAGQPVAAPGDFPSAPPVLAAALLATAGLSTLLVGRSRR